MKNLVKLFVARYVATISLFGALVLFGVVSYVGLGVDLFPEIEIPIVSVSTTYPGAGSEEVVRQLSEPIEGTLSTLPGISNVTSTSSEGLSIVTAEFNSGINVDEAAIDVSQRVNTVAGELPTDASAPTVQKFDPAAEPIMTLAVTAPGIALGDVQTYIENNVQPALRRVDGVADVAVIGPTAREVQVLLDSALLASYDLSPSQVSDAISGSALDLPIGDVTFSGSRILLTGRNTPETVAAIEEIQVDSARGIRVLDVATVRDTSAEVATYARVDGEPVVLLEVQKTSGSNSVAIGDNVELAVETLTLPVGYSARIVTDTTTETETTVNGTIDEIFIAIAAVALVVMFFVGRLGTVLAVILAIPISIAGAFILFGVAGFTLNLITLLSITVAVGLVVDDSIVVAENIDRFQSMGYDRKEAVVRGASEVATAVLAATLSLLAVFLPISFLPGVVGDFFRQFGLSMAAMITFSYLASMFFLTMFLAYMPNPLPPGWRDLPKALGALGADLRWTGALFRKVWFYILMVAIAAALYFLGPVFQLSPVVTAAALLLPAVLFVLRYVGRLTLYFLGAIFLTLYKAGDRTTNFIRDAYASSLDSVLNRAWIVLGVAALLFGTLFFVFPRIGFVFTPPSDTGQLVITMELPTGTSLDQTNFLANTLETYLFADPLIETVQTTVGVGDTTGDSSPNRVSITADLAKEREASTDELVVTFEERLGTVLAGYPEAKLSIASETGGAPTSDGYTLNLTSSDLELLRERETEIRAVVSENPNLRNVESSLAASLSERVFVIDNAGLTGTGLTPAAIYETLRAYKTGSTAGKLRTEGNEYDIVVQANPLDIKDEQMLLSLPIYAPALETEVPISQFGRFETRDAPSTINRANQAYALDFTADLAPEAEDLLSVRTDIEGTLRDGGLIDSRVVQGSASGIDLLGDLVLYGPIAFVLALLLNYLVIGTQFNSFKFPLYLLLTVPLALVGALWLLYATGTDLDFIGVLGVVMLIGLVTKNAILLLEVLMERINEEGGKVASLKEALIEAGRLRFRPIIMTTAAVAIISLPLILGFGEGAELRYSLGLIILGGVVTSALLTFYVVPAAFYQFERRNFERGQEGSGSQTTPLRTAERTSGRTVVVAPLLPQTASTNEP